MEGNPIWSLTEYSYHLVTALPKLTVLDQQEVSSEVRSNAQKWKTSQLGICIDLQMILNRCAANKEIISTLEYYIRCLNNLKGWA